MIRYFAELDSINEFYLYTNKAIYIVFNLPQNFHVIEYKAISGTIGVVFNLAALLKRDKIDVFWGPEHCLPLGQQPFKRVLTIHDLSVLFHYKLGTRYNYIIQKLITIPSIKCADKIVAISYSTANDVAKYTDMSKCEVVYNGDSPYKGHDARYSNEELRQTLEKYSLKNDNYFLFVGSIEPRKNIRTIVDAFNRYKKETKSNIKLVLAGGLGWRYKKILRDINRSPYKKDIIQTGYCSDIELEILYRNCIGLLFPSIYEGFGFPILEAMSVGKPVVTSRVSSLPEVGGDIAYYIDDVYDSTTLCQKMIDVVQLTDGKRSILAEKSKERANMFSRKECAKKLLNIIKKQII